MQPTGAVRSTQANEVPRSCLDYSTKQIVAIGPELTVMQRVAVLEHARALRSQIGSLNEMGDAIRK
jgi:hypothetical protein